MLLTNLNPTSDIGANGWVLELDGARILLDAGLHPKREGKEALPSLDLLNSAGGVDAVAVTHCHLDHVGALPVIMERFPDVQAYMTDLSYFIVERVLHNAVNVMKRKREETGNKDYPLYLHRQVEDIAPRIQAYRARREVEWSVPQRRGGFAPTLEFFDAGHTLGSAGVLVRGATQSVFYSGDVCFQDQTILKGADFEEVRADVLVLETTRGAKDTSTAPRRDSEAKRLRDSIVEVVERRGTALIPSFALGRTQEVLANIALLIREGRLPRQPVYIGHTGERIARVSACEGDAQLGRAQPRPACWPSLAPDERHPRHPAPTIAGDGTASEFFPVLLRHGAASSAATSAAASVRPSPIDSSWDGCCANHRGPSCQSQSTETLHPHASRTSASRQPIVAGSRRSGTGTTPSGTGHRPR